MSLAWYIVAEAEPEGLDLFVNGKAIAHVNEEALDNIFGEIGAKHLDEFVSADPDEFADFLDDLDSVEVSDEKWFSADEGLASVNALLAHLGANPDCLDNQAAVVSDLEEYLVVLNQLKERGIKWHLAIDI